MMESLTGHVVYLSAARRRDGHTDDTDGTDISGFRKGRKRRKNNSYTEGTESAERIAMRLTGVGRGVNRIV